MKKQAIYKVEPVMPLFLGFFHVKSFQNENYWGNTGILDGGLSLMVENARELGGRGRSPAVEETAVIASAAK
jgi:hypothetical protein